MARGWGILIGVGQPEVRYSDEGVRHKEMKPEIDITDELLSKFCDVRPKAIPIDEVDKGDIFPR